MKQLKLWKRNVIVAAIVLFVCGAVYMNWSYNKQETAAGKTLGEAALVGAKGGSDQAAAGKEEKQDNAKAEQGASAKESAYFSEARLNRQQARDSAMSLLQQAAKDDKASKETIEDANKAIQTMASNTLTEAQIENLVVAKGYTNCVAFLNDDGIKVVVSGTESGLTDTDVAKIGEIVMDETGLKTDQIKIIPTE